MINQLGSECVNVRIRYWASAGSCGFIRTFLLGPTSEMIA